MKKDNVANMNVLLSKTSFDYAIKNYFNAMKLLIITADNCSLDDLRKLSMINVKLGKRLEVFIKLREQEELSKKKFGEDTLFDILQFLDDNAEQMN